MRIFNKIIDILIYVIFIPSFVCGILGCFNIEPVDMFFKIYNIGMSSLWCIFFIREFNLIRRFLKK